MPYTNFNNDAFICHASEDKKAVVEPLAIELTRLGARIWYDKWSLEIGDSLRRKIDEGLNDSKFGIVVLSKNFFAKNWPQYELDGLVEREMGGTKVILPVWHGVDRADVERYSPTLSARFAGRSSDSVVQLATQLMNAMHLAPATAGGLAANPDPHLRHFGPAIETRFATVTLPREVPTTPYGSPHSPKGIVILHDVPFVFQPTIHPTGAFFDHEILDLLPSSMNDRTIRTVRLYVTRVSKVHVVLSAGNSRSEFAGKRIGFINLPFSNGGAQECAIVLGRHVREWAYGNDQNLVREIDTRYVKPAWISHDYSRLLDMLTISVNPPAKTIEQIDFIAEFEEQLPGTTKVAMRISAVTCERQPME